ncbi:heparin lyase I family protein [Aggregatimonas sangjinii]|nr:heparin lyase I family protein [Aggregatimonas sangjinii]
MKLPKSIAKNSIGIILSMLLIVLIYGVVGTPLPHGEIAYTSGIVDSVGCRTSGGLANDSGLKVWCWSDVNIPEYTGQQGVAFSDGQLKVDSECDERQVTIVNGQLVFSLDPSSPPPGKWCAKNFNMRAEIRTVPWHVNHKKGTEEWFGWSYTFGSDYIIDKETPWLFFQVHPGIQNVAPQMALWVIKKNQFNGHEAGEIYVVNTANNTEYQPTGIIPEAGETLNIVIHAVWDDAANGLLQIWLNGVSVYDRQVATVFDKYPWGGNAKWGIYKWRWANADDVKKSRQKGVTKLQTSMGPLRMITRTPDHPAYGKNAYSTVMPQ